MRYAMRLVMTRVLPDPAPARIRSGPSVWRTARRCSGFSASRKCTLSFYRHRLGQIARLIDITSAAHGDVVGKQLQRDDEQNRNEEFRRRRNRENDIAARLENRRQLVLAARRH